jgi:hypothetical protein
MAIWHFPVTLSGSGETIEEAWADAVEGFCDEPGYVDENSAEFIGED